MAKIPKSLRSFHDPKAMSVRGYVSPPPVAPPAGRMWTRRLSYSVGTNVRYDEPWFLDLLQQDFNRRVAFFFDANTFIERQSDAFWCGFQNRCNPVRVTSDIFNELTSFRSQHTKNPIAVQELAAAESGSGSLFEIHTDDPALEFSIRHYASLLSVRKRVDLVAPNDVKEGGRQSITEWAQRTYGERTAGIYNKAAKSTQVSFADERMVVAAVVHAIRTGEDAAIFTYDEDVIDQFRKLIWILDTHYRAMLFGRALLSSSPPRQLGLRNDLPFAGPNAILFSKPSDGLRELLPSEWRPVTVTCYRRVGSEISQISFMFETNMSELLETKQSTKGRNSIAFVPDNVHVHVGPWVTAIGNPAVVCRDRILTSEPFSTDYLSRLDIEFALHDSQPQMDRYLVPKGGILLPEID